MILVVGATGLLGAEICSRLGAAGEAVRAMVRATSAPGKVAELVSSGAATVTADLKDSASLSRACAGVEAVITTASCTFSRQEGDSIETVDLQGQLRLIEEAKKAGVERFLQVSIPPGLRPACALFDAKRAVEEALAAGGIDYTILQANYFMEVWLSPALGFDYPNHRATVYGSGEAPLRWVSYRDVAAVACDAVRAGSASPRTLLVGGPENLSPNEVIGIFERSAGVAFAVERVPYEALETRYAQAADPLSRSFAALMLAYAHGCTMDVSETLRLFPRRLTSVAEYAASQGALDAAR